MKICICEYCEIRLKCKGCVKNCKLCGIRTDRCKENYIRVQYRNGIYGNVENTILDSLIESGKIIKFYRSGGWVTIGSNSIRVSTKEYNGLETRKSLRKR